MNIEPVSATTPDTAGGRCQLRLAVVLVALSLVVGCKPSNANRNVQTAVPVVLADARVRLLTAELRLPGMVEAQRTVKLRAQTDGIIVATHVADGERVQREQVLFEIDPRPARITLARARSELSMERAEYQRLQAQLKRCERVAAAGFVSNEDLQRCRSDIEIAAARIRRGEAEVAAAELALERTIIRSPIDGRLGRLRVRTGDLIAAEDELPLATIRQTTPVHVAFSVTNRDFSLVRSAIDAGNLELWVEGRGLKMPIRARFAYAENAADPASGTIRLRASAENVGEALWPGTFVEVVAVYGTKPSIAIPEAAVKAGLEGDYVYLVDSRSRARLRTVVVARRAQGMAAIASGLKSGDRVVLDGHSRLRDGTLIHAADAAP